MVFVHALLGANEGVCDLSKAPKRHLRVQRHQCAAPAAALRPAQSCHTHSSYTSPCRPPCSMRACLCPCCADIMIIWDFQNVRTPTELEPVEIIR